MVQRIKHIRADLQFHPFDDPEVLGEAEIQIPKPGRTQRTGAVVACTNGRTGGARNRYSLERRGIEIAKSVLVVGQERLPTNIVAALIRRRRTLGDDDGEAGLCGENSRKL